MAEPRQNVIFEQVDRVSPPEETTEGLVVELAGDRVARLSPDDERAAGYASILEELQRQERPVYLELDAEDNIERLLVPLVARVEDVRPAPEEEDRGDPGDLQITLYGSHARHLLRRESRNFEAAADLLRRAREESTTVAVVSDDRQEILAAKPHDDATVIGPPVGGGGTVGSGPGVEEAPESEPRGCLGRIFRRRRRKCLSKRRAQKLFDDMASRSCAPLTVPPPCIPFLYPDDGCWGRAHEMCRLMVQEHGILPKKVWIYGSLVTPTKNNPNCVVYWGWHVAPTVCVRSGCLGGTQEMVIDPSLFDKPVTKGTWKSVQGDAGAVLQDSAWTIFYRSQNAGYTDTDPTFAKTNGVLNTYRAALQARSLTVGPPPYAGC